MFKYILIYHTGFTSRLAIATKICKTYPDDSEKRKNEIQYRLIERGCQLNLLPTIKPTIETDPIVEESQK